MTQGEVLQIIEKSKKPLTTKEIAKILGKGHTAINCNLKRLRQANEVRWVQVKIEGRLNGAYQFVYFKK